MTQMPYSLIMEFKRLPKTTNQMKNAAWFYRKKEADVWEKQIMGEMLIKKLSPPKSPLKKARLKLTRYSAKSPDFDGLVSSFKHVIDGLIKNGIIEDDSYEHIGKPDYEWEKIKINEGKIRVEVYET